MRNQMPQAEESPVSKLVSLLQRRYKKNPMGMSWAEFKRFAIANMRQNKEKK